MKLKSNEPFWLIKNGLLHSYPSLQEDASCDVLIVGAGITGSLIAHQCIKDGYKTILIDKREIANGSTSATTSMLQYEIDVPLYKLIETIGEEGAIKSYHACLKAIYDLEEICKEIKSKAGFKKKKSLYFASKKIDAVWLKKEFEARKTAKLKVKWLDATSVSNTFNIKNTHGAILSKDGASVDAFTLTHELLHYNNNKGLQIYDKTEMIKAVSNVNYTEVTLNTKAKIKTQKIIYATGYETTSIIKEKFVNLISTYAIVSEIDPVTYKKLDDLLIWNTADPYIYLRTTADHRFLIGGEDEPFKNPIKRDALINNKTIKLEKLFEKHTVNLNFKTDFSWAGTFGTTKDGLPYIGTHKNHLNCYFVLGFGGNGITFSITGMSMVSDWLKGKEHFLTYWFRFGR